MLGVLPILAVLAIYFVVKSTDAEKRVPIQYSRSVNGKSSIGAGHSYIPIKVVMSGVMPIIFASTIGAFRLLSARLLVQIGMKDSVMRYSDLIPITGYMTYLHRPDFAFNYFYIDIQFDAVQIANSLRERRHNSRYSAWDSDNRIPRKSRKVCRIPGCSDSRNHRGASDYAWQSHGPANPTRWYDTAYRLWCGSRSCDGGGFVMVVRQHKGFLD